MMKVRRAMLNAGPLRLVIGVLALLPTVGPGVEASARDVRCEHGWQSALRERTVDVCVIRELLTHATRSLSVYLDSRGGLDVTHWDRDEMLVRANVHTWADDEEKARAIEKRIVIRMGDVVRAYGPDDRSSSWSVSYEIFVPHGTRVDSIVPKEYAFPTVFTVALLAFMGVVVLAYGRLEKRR